MVVHDAPEFQDLPDLGKFSAFCGGTPEGIQLDPLFLWR